MLIKGPKIGQVVKDGKIVSEQFMQLETTTTDYCWRHLNITRNLDNPKNPTERDKKILAKITFKPVKTRDKKGNVEMGRQCPKCGNFVKIELSKMLTPSLDIDIDDKTKTTHSNKVGQIL